MLLEIRGITVHYGKSMAIQDVSLGVVEGEVVSIIGANGAGKSTVLRALSGLIPLTSGEIRFQGAQINGKETTEIVRLGISLVPEGRQLFPYLSVLSNLKLGVSVLLVEQNIHLALGVASRGYALQVGRVVLEGDIETMKSSDIVKRAYLGG
jgi:ABC-type branched-subunit amino acid transport system ATPase component